MRRCHPPVSYTHLDVYKRQVYDYARKRGVSEEAITNLLIPVTEGLSLIHI